MRRTTLWLRWGPWPTSPGDLASQADCAHVIADTQGHDHNTSQGPDASRLILSLAATDLIDRTVC